MAVAATNSVGVSGVNLATGTETSGASVAVDGVAVGSTNSVGVAGVGILGAFDTTSATSGALSAQLRAASDDCGDDSALPDTGGSNLSLLIVGALMLAAGGAVVAGARRRQNR